MALCHNSCKNYIRGQSGSNSVAVGWGQLSPTIYTDPRLLPRDLTIGNENWCTGISRLCGVSVRDSRGKRGYAMALAIE